MKNTLLPLLLFVSLNVYGSVNIFPVSVISEYSSSNPFRGVENISLPNDGELISKFYFTNDEIFENGNTYKRIHHIPGSSAQFDANSFWPYNSTNHTFTLDIIYRSQDARWRPITWNENGTINTLGWVNLNTGTNSINLGAEGDYERPVIGFSTEGTFRFRKFTHTFGSSSFGYEEISVAIPEPSTYALLVGALALGFAAKRRK
jgi:hypothetical protein